MGATINFSAYYRLPACVADKESNPDFGPNGGLNSYRFHAQFDRAVLQ